MEATMKELEHYNNLKKELEDLQKWKKDVKMNKTGIAVGQPISFFTKTEYGRPKCFMEVSTRERFSKVVAQTRFYDPVMQIVESQLKTEYTAAALALKEAMVNFIADEIQPAVKVTA
jgi:hypothetical protein